MRRQLALFTLALLAALVIRAYMTGPSAVAREDAVPVVFYMLERDKPLGLSLGAARALKLAVRWQQPLDGHERKLELQFLDRDGVELAREELALPALAPDPSGVPAWSRPSWIRLVPPEHAATLAIGTQDSGVAVRLTGGAPSRRRAPDYKRLRVDALLLNGAEERRLRALKWAPLAARSEVQTVVLPLPDSTVRTTAAAAVPAAVAARRVDADHATAFNVMGPGRATLRASGSGRLDIQVLGADMEALEMAVPGELAVSLPAGPASIVVRAVEHAHAEIEMVLQGAAALEPKASALRKRTATLLRRGAVARYLLDGTTPVRLRAARAGRANASVSWRLLQAERELARGELKLPEAADVFSFLSSVVAEGASSTPVGESVARVLLPEGADALELFSSSDVVAGVDLRVERGADPSPRAPFSAAPSGCHWIAVASRVPAWVALKPSARSRTIERVTVFRTPRLEETRKEGASEFSTLKPGAGRAVAVREPGARRVERRPSAVLKLAGRDAVHVMGAAPTVHRTAYELTPERPIELVINAGKAGSHRVYMAVYSPVGEVGRVSAVIDGGAVRRRRGMAEQLTSAEHSWSLAAGGGRAQISAAGPVGRSLSTIKLGDDLVPGRHVLSIRNEGTARVWVRFWTPGRRVKRERVSLWISEEPAE